MLPLLGEKGKIVTLGSTAGKMSFAKISNEELKNKWRKADLSKEELFNLVHQFEAGVANNTYEQEGWPKWSYGISKLAINVYHSILARNEAVLKKSIQIYVCCPGYVKTDMTSHKGVLSLEEGILTPVYLIELPFEVNQEWQGGFFYLQKHVSIFE